MRENANLRSLHDDDLLRGLTEMLRRSRRVEADLVAFVAELRPREDVRAGMRKLPARQPERTGSATPDLRSGSATAAEHRPDDVPLRPVSRRRPAANVEPLAPARYQVKFTASTALHDKLERLQALMRSSVPDGDLGSIIEAAVTEKLERLEAKRFGKTKVPRKSLAETKTAPMSRSIPAAVRRAVYERDEGRCTYADARGRRCSARDRLEFHHHGVPFGRGGDHSPHNIRLACRTHNLLMAELEYGKEKMERYRRSPSNDRVSERLVLYAAGTTAGSP